MKAYRIFMVSVIVVLAANLVFKSCQAKPRAKKLRIGVVLDPSTQPIKPYVQEYFNNKLKYLKVNNTKYEIHITMTRGMAEVFDGEVGQCHFNDKSLVRAIKIDRDWWRASSELERRTLVHHELAHCDLNYDHDASDKKNIMHTHVYHKFTEELFQQKVKEMFLNHTKVFKKLDGSNF